MDDRTALHGLAQHMGVHTSFVDGLGSAREASDETLVQICRTLGAHLDGPSDAPSALAAITTGATDDPPPVIVAWDGVVGLLPGDPGTRAAVDLEDGTVVEVLLGTDPAGAYFFPPGYHHLRTTVHGAPRSITVISAPTAGMATAGQPPLMGRRRPPRRTAIEHAAVPSVTFMISAPLAVGYARRAATR